MKTKITENEETNQFGLISSGRKRAQICKPIGLDLDETARILTQSDGGPSIYLRAILLFEFQICFYWPKALSSEKSASRINARLFAALKLLEHLEQKIAANSKNEVISLKKLAANSDYAQIFDEIILRSGGSRRIQKMPRSKDFDEQLKYKKGEVLSVAKIVDFSYRFARLNPKTRAKGGITMSRSIVSTAPSYKYRKKISTLKTRWREYGPTAGFLYLLRISEI